MGLVYLAVTGLILVFLLRRLHRNHEGEPPWASTLLVFVLAFIWPLMAGLLLCMVVLAILHVLLIYLRKV